jgi:adenylate cyclase
MIGYKENTALKGEDFFNRVNIVELSFFNFRNAITAAYFANIDFEILTINENFRKFFPILGNVSNASFPDVLEHLGVPGAQIDLWVTGMQEKGSVLIPKVEIQTDGTSGVFSLMSTRTVDDNFSYLNGIQGQFVDRTEEWTLRQERETLLEEKIRDQEIIEGKNIQLEQLATRLAKYLSPQIYESIFSGKQSGTTTLTRKNLTIFFSDIEGFTDLTDTLEPERLAAVINLYHSEMSAIAIDCGGTLDKFIGDAIMVFFGDPETNGEVSDALNATEMSLRMKRRIKELQSHWKKLGVPDGFNVRMGITTGYCAVGNLGSEQRLDYSVLGSPVNLAQRLQSLAASNTVLISEETYNLIHEYVECVYFDEVTPKGFARPIKTYVAKDFVSAQHRQKRLRLSRTGKHIEVNVIDSSDIRAAIEELRRIQLDFEEQFNKSIQ